MKKVLCVFMAIVFVCCVMVHGKDERFSLEKMITNLTKFENMPSADSFVDIWTKNSFSRCTYQDYPYWVDYHVYLGEDVGYVSLKYPLAYNIDGTLKENVDYYWSPVIGSGGRMWMHDDPFASVDVGCYVPPDVDLVTSGIYEYAFVTDAYYVFETYDGDEPIFEFFDDVKGFFLRLGQTFLVAFDWVASVTRNAQYLLPWNNTVPKEV